MKFKKYQHIEKIDHPATQGLLFGECYVFPKIDGTNASIWVDNLFSQMQCGSRNRQLSVGDDNAGFAAWANQQTNIIAFLNENPDLRLFGEWLVPHSLKTYRSDAWRDFYVFDVVRPHDTYLHYNEYQPLMEDFRINYIPPIAKIENPSMDTLHGFLTRNKFLIEDGKGDGEGIVVKNYNYRNRHNKQNWAKIVTNDFKAKHTRSQGPTKMVEKSDVEENIVNDLVTTTAVEKVYSKIIIDNPWENKFIPKLLNLVFFDLVNEESWRFVKKYKNPTIDFRRLQGITFAKVKTIKPELF